MQPAAPGTASWAPAGPTVSSLAADGTVPAPRAGGAPVPTFAPVPEPARPAGAATPDDEDEDWRPRHPYTWLHFLALILVAFVLGFLIVLLYMRSGADSGPGAQAAAVHQILGVTVHRA